MTELYNGSCQRILHSAEGLCLESYVRVMLTTGVFNSDIESFIHHYFNGIFQQCKENITFEMYYEGCDTYSRKPVIISKNYIVIHVMFRDDVDSSNISIDYLGTNLTAVSELFDGQNRDTCSGQILKEFVKVNLMDGIICPSKPLMISKFLACAMIQINITDYNVTKNKTGTFIYDLNLFLSEKDILRIGHTQIQICMDTYIKTTEDYAKFKNQAPKSETFFMYLISLICLCCSVVCLITTIAVYLLLPPLQTQPGVNNLFLSVSLLLAYVILLIGALPSLQSVACTAAGLFVHFLWLNSMFWMNICSFHMYKSFGNIQVTLQRKATKLYTAYCIIFSAALVCLNIIWSVIRSHGKSVGYGKRSNICYIMYSDMIAYTMTIPVGLVILGNVLMYVAVVYRITRMPLVPANTVKDRHYFIIYVKLSTITGIAWLSYIPVLLTEHFILEIVFTVLVACQGIFIMFAFLCNRRVLNLMAEKVRGNSVSRDRPSKETRSKRTTVTNVM